MTDKHSKLLLSTLSAAVLFTVPFLASADDHGSCDSHARHIDHEIGAQKAIAAFHVLHGDNADSGHIIDELKHDHPDIEHELEAFVSSGCAITDLEAHAHDDDH